MKAWRKLVNVAGAGAVLARGRIGAPRPEAPPPTYPKLFVVGCPRSGTSWLTWILSHHPKVVSTAESNAYDEVFAPIVRSGRRSLSTWAPLLYQDDMGRRLERGTGIHRYVDRSTLRRLAERAVAEPSWSDETAGEEVVRGIFDAFFVGAGGTSSHLLVEKTPVHVSYAPRILRQFPEAKMVEMVRDGRDVCVSMQMLDRDWAPKDRREQIDRWVTAIRQGMELRADPELAPRVLQVRFEDLKADPVREIDHLFEFAGLQRGPDLVTEIAEWTEFGLYRGSGWKGARKGAVGDWRNHFTAEDIELFDRLAGDLLVASGYEPSTL